MRKIIIVCGPCLGLAFAAPALAQNAVPEITIFKNPAMRLLRELCRLSGEKRFRGDGQTDARPRRPQPHGRYCRRIPGLSPRNGRRICGERPRAGQDP